MSALIDYIQIEIHKTYNKKYSKKYIEDKLIPIINYICSSKSKKFLFGGSQGIGKSSFINIISKTIIIYRENNDYNYQKKYINC